MMQKFDDKKRPDDVHFYVEAFWGIKDYIQ